ncbi:MAG: response regulator [Chloroflexi bacterium]|jgi:two-component system response regulator MtrA|nr:response regulator [Chloroflexota bacterium]
MESKTVLIVDDEMSNTQLFGMMLELEGYRPVAAVDEPTALEALRQQTPDVMIVDVMLPGASGLDLCRKVRNELGLADLPIVIVSAKSQLADVQAGVAAGATVYLTKPVTKAELLGAVRQAVGEGE